MKPHFLSYELTEELSSYGGGKGIQIKQERQMCCGDTSNNTSFWMPTHHGTHVDFPFHFSDEGKAGSAYSAGDFIYDSIEVAHLDLRERDVPLIEADDILAAKNPSATALILKTYFCEIRESQRYWENGPGFQPEVAKKLKANWPNLQLIGFDGISLTNFQNRPLGRVAHKAFLMENDLLILEDMDLKEVSAHTLIRQMVMAPLRMKNADGAPVTVFAELEQMETK